MIRVIVVDDHPIVRHGLTTILKIQRDIEVVGEAADGAEAVQQIVAHRPDVVLLDLRLPEFSGVEVMRQIRALALPVRFLVLTTYDTDAYLGPALAAGANGYLLKDAMPDELLRAVRALAQGGGALEPGVAARLLERVSESGSEALSARELDVLKLLVGGAGNKAIAVRLTLSENTVKYHVGNILSKLNVQSRSEAVAVAIQRGLVELN